MLGVVLIVAVLAMPPSAASAASAFERATALEREGRITEAAQALAGARLRGSEQRHADHVRATARALRAADVYLRNDSRDPAVRVLTKARKDLDPVRQPYLALAVERRLEDARDESLVDQGAAWAARTATDVATWVAVALTVTALAGGLWLLGRWALARAPARKGLAIAVDDVSVEPAVRRDASLTLGRQLSSALTASPTSPRAASVTELDLGPDLDGGMVLNARVEGALLNALDPAIGEGTVVTLGPVAVPVRQVAAVVSMAFSRPSERELRGHLFVDGTTTGLDLSLHRAGAATPEAHWAVRHTGDGARRRAIDETAARLRFQLAGSAISDTWPSVAAYREGCARLERADAAANRVEALLDARRCFERALAHDQKNARARFDLATVLRRLGHNEDAAAQLLVLARQLEGRDDPSSAAIRRACAYARAVALSKIPRWEEHNEAERLLRELCAELRGTDGAEVTRETQRLYHLACSALAAALVFKLEQWRRNPDARHRVDAVVAHITALRDELGQAPAHRASEDWIAHSYALAIAENAFGRAVYLRGRSKDAIAAFERALSVMADLGDAHVNMASALRVGKRSAERDERARRHLERALELSPRNPRANFLLGQHFEDLGNDEEARQAYAAAGDDAASLFRLARLAWNDEDVSTAARFVRRSMRCNPTPDRRTWTLLEWAVTAQRRGTDDEALREEALQASRHMRKALRVRKQPMHPQMAKWLEELERPRGPRKFVRADATVVSQGASNGVDGRAGPPPRESEDRDLAPTVPAGAE